MARQFGNSIFRWVTLLLGLWLAWDLLSRLVAEIFWFQEVGYLSTFLKRLQTQFGLWVVVCSTSAGFLLSNLLLASRLKYPKSLIKRQQLANSSRTADNGQQTTNSVLTLRSFLPLVLSLSILVGVMLLHYGKIAVSLWRPDLSLPSITPPLPDAFSWVSFQSFFVLKEWTEFALHLGVIGIVAIALVVNPQLWLSAISVALSLCFGLALSRQWGHVLQYVYPTPFSVQEPLFKQDISFYVFNLPVWHLLDFWLGGLCLFALVAVTLVYLLSGDSFSQGKFPGFSPIQLRHLYGLSTVVAVFTAFHYWLSRYQLLYSTRSIAYGAGYTDVNVQLSVNTGLSILAVAIAICLALRTIFWFQHFKTTGQELLAGLGLYLIIAVTAGVIAPLAIQRFVVQPNELARERPYIQRSIALTRQAFDLDDIDAETFNPQGELTLTDLAKNDQTIRNIRLWDTRPLLETNRQLQQIRLYYKFPGADIDRYTLKTEVEAVPPIAPEANTNRSEKATTSATSEQQQVIIAGRELDYNAVPQQAKTWINKHLTYTHGYGFTLSPVNQVGSGGLPEYYVKNIGIGVAANGTGTLETSSESIRASIPIGAPRIYYGEITDTYVMTASKVKEFDYPSGDENVYNTYDGNGGIPLNSKWRRVLFAQYLKDWQMLFTRNFTPQTRLLFRRNINQRIRAIAPFLRYDSDPYLVTAKVKETDEVETESYLYWIVDAYTTSDRYPYSDPGNHEFNYIRNSVKVVIDAYNGDVDFYVADPQDPIIKTWSAIFPGLLKPLDAMPAALRSHIRYPLDFFSVQSERLLTYHMTDPQVFYNREDQWQVPQEIYGAERQAVQPYYLIMKLPIADSEEFILLLPFTPTQRNNLIAWLAARSDGENYGKLLLYQFPKQELIYGTEQIEALINQDPVISQQISLWNRQGSRALQGNLLVIPIERSLLYVEPLYLEAEQNSLPTLVRVIVVYENRIVMAETLEKAVQAIFQPEQPSTPAIIRSVDEPVQP
ncbi:MAG TPA: UPF0182 family protein [Coleofasciculaceae cyanobacterium]